MLPRFGVTNLYAIIVNYFTCFLLGSSINGTITLQSDILSKSWFPFALFLSLIFIMFFNVNAYTIQKVGVTVTSVFQKLSLVAPAMVGIVMFGEPGNPKKYFALLLAIVSILLINYSDESDPKLAARMKKYWYWPLIVFFGSGLIESILFYAQETGQLEDAGLVFTSNLFFMAGCWGSLFVLLRGRFDIKWKDVVAGICLGIPNFFTIYLIIVALESGWDGSSFFPLINVGVILGTAVVGISIFLERFNKVNIMGFICALLVVVLISL